MSKKSKQRSNKWLNPGLNPDVQHCLHPFCDKCVFFFVKTDLTFTWN